MREDYVRAIQLFSGSQGLGCLSTQEIRFWTTSMSIVKPYPENDIFDQKQ